MPRTRKVKRELTPATDNRRGQGLARRKPNRSGSRGYLASLMEDTPETYEQMLGYLRIGASYIAAMNAIGIETKTAQEWLKKGKEGTGIYATLWHDVRSAVGLASVQTEGEVRKKMGLEWLRKGPRQMLGDGLWAEDESRTSHTSTTTHNSHINIQAVTHNTLPTLEALRELQAVGIDLNALVHHDPNQAVPSDDVIEGEVSHEAVGTASLPQLPGIGMDGVRPHGVEGSGGSGSGGSGYGHKESPYPLPDRSNDHSNDRSNPCMSPAKGNGTPTRSLSDPPPAPGSLLQRISKTWKK